MCDQMADLWNGMQTSACTIRRTSPNIRPLMCWHRVLFTLCLMANPNGQYLSVFLQKGKSKVHQYLTFFRETIRKLELLADSKTNKEFENILKESHYANVKEFIEKI